MSRARVAILLGAVLLLVALLLGLLLPNRDPVWFRLFWSQRWAVSLWSIMVLCAVGGLALGVALMAPLWLGQRRQRQRCQVKLRAADDEVTALRRILAQEAVRDSKVGLPQT
ncbi:MAG: DUF1049 domain-containing protein [Deltaproteobacteria bacterium]|nr:DUF1049 domain-containing protein [Deltaproteobacteria bacterium]